MKRQSQAGTSACYSDTQSILLTQSYPAYVIEEGVNKNNISGGTSVIKVIKVFFITETQDNMIRSCSLLKVLQPSKAIEVFSTTKTNKRKKEVKSFFVSIRKILEEVCLFKRGKKSKTSRSTAHASK